MDRLSYVVLSTTDWDAPQFGSRQQIAQELARRGHCVMFVEVPRAPHSLISDPAATLRAIPRMGHVHQIPDGPRVYTPPAVLSPYYHPVVNAINQRLMREYLRGVLRGLGSGPDVLWTYWPNTAYLIGRMGERASVYHCIDDFTAVRYPLSPNGAIAHMEEEQCRCVDLIITRSERLAARLRRLNRNTHILAGGVDTHRFDPSLDTLPRADVGRLPSPRVGFVGTLDNRLDPELIVHCARAIPEASFVLVGPVKRHLIDLGVLSNADNIHVLPPCLHEEAPAVVAAFDVCLIPYAVNDYTRALSPVKLYEYLAMARPVVSTDLPYVARERAHVFIATTSNEFVAGVREALRQPSSEQMRACWRNAAEEHTWRAQVDAVEMHIGRVLAMSR